MNYYQHHLGDYLRDTAHLSMLEDGAYRRLLDQYYIREKPLPLDIRECWKLARAYSKAERSAVAYILKSFFEQRDDGYHQSRADLEVGRNEEKRSKAVASAQVRWTRPSVDANALRTHTESDANALRTDMPTQCSPIPNPQSPIEEQSISPETSADDPKPNGAKAPGVTKLNGKRQSQSRRAPPGFSPDLAFALEQIPDLDAETEAARFLDYEFAKPRSDWEACWRNWIRTCRDKGQYARRSQSGKINPREWM